MQQLALFEPDDQQIAPAAKDQTVLALLPFMVGSADRTQPVKLAYQAEVDGKLRRMAVTLRPGAELELPTHADQLVFLALLQLTFQQSTSSNVLHFKRSEVHKLLGWSDGGGYYGRMRQALERLTSLTITVHSALLSREGKEYQRGAAAAGLIDSFQLTEGYDSICTVEWGHIVREGFRLGDFKRLDWRLLRELDNPLTVQLYRLLDRVVLAGDRTWRVGWHTLAAALGMNAAAYSRAARFRQVLEPHFSRLTDEGVIEVVDYERGGTFVFHLTNYLRSQLRRILGELGVYPEAARQLVAGYEELEIMAQVDCHQHGQRQAGGVGHLVEAIRGRYQLRYPEDDPTAFDALFDLFGTDEIRQAVALGRKLGLRISGEPRAWPLEARAVVRFVLSQGIDPERV